MTATQTPAVQLEYLALLREELALVAAETAPERAIIAQSALGTPALAAASEVYAGVFERTRETCEFIGLHGLAAVCAGLAENLAGIVTAPVTARGGQLTLLWAWPEALSSYLEDPADLTRNVTLLD